MLGLRIFEDSEGKTNLSISELKEGDCIRVKGTVRAEERAPHGKEIRAEEITILSSPAEPLPLAIDKWKLNTSLEAKLNYRSISLRNIQERSKFKIQEALVKAFRDYLYKQGFTEIHTPKIGSKGAEGGANVFKLSYLDCNRTSENQMSCYFFAIYIIQKIVIYKMSLLLN